MSINKEKPILFSTDMVRAILDGNKTMTRRIIKPQPSMTSGEFDSWIDKTGTIFCTSTIRMPIYCPYGRVGNILWVRETFRVPNPYGKPDYEFKADWDSYNTGINYKWKPSIFMPKEACRLRLKITNVKVERLHNITDEDAIAEGIEKTEFGYKNYNNTYPVKEFMGGVTEALQSYKSLWIYINGKSNWDANPWVWVIEFEIINK